MHPQKPSRCILRPLFTNGYLFLTSHRAGPARDAVSGRSNRNLQGTSGYSTVYEFASTAVPESPEWKEQQQHSSPNSPRMRQAMTHAPGSAGVYVRVNP